MDHNIFTPEESSLLCMYTCSSRTPAGLISMLNSVRPYVDEDDREILKLMDSTVSKLRSMTDEEFAALELVPDYED